MQCPACKSASPDDVRFCLHCGQYLGEPDEATRVHYRPPPPTTIRADFNPIQFQSPITYEQPVRRRWPMFVAGATLATIAMLIVGGVIASVLMRGGAPVANAASPTPTSVRVDARDLGVRFTPTPRPSMAPTLTASAPSTETVRRVYEPTPTPYFPTPTPSEVPRLAQATVIINWANSLRDGQFISWEIPPGFYQLQLTSASDGARVEWNGTENCDFKTKDMLQFTQRCKMMRQGHLTVSNPTTFGLGAAIFVTVKVTRY